MGGPNDIGWVGCPDGPAELDAVEPGVAELGMAWVGMAWVGVPDGGGWP
ncbi:hypothetical protein AB0C29_27670 [Actinoplanes sp. NPDC048791]